MHTCFSMRDDCPISKSVRMNFECNCRDLDFSLQDKTVFLFFVVAISAEIAVSFFVCVCMNVYRDVI